MDWCLFYEGGLTFTSEMGLPSESPRSGLVLISQKDPRSGADSIGWLLLAGDFFSFHSGRWWNHDLAGLLDNLVSRALDVTTVRIGRYVSESEFFDLKRKAMQMGMNQSARIPGQR